MSSANRAISCDTVGSDPTRPNTPGCARAEHPGLRAQHRDISGRVPAERDRDREIQHDLARIPAL